MSEKKYFMVNHIPLNIKEINSATKVTGGLFETINNIPFDAVEVVGMVKAEPNIKENFTSIRINNTEEEDIVVMSTQFTKDNVVTMMNSLEIFTIVKILGKLSVKDDDDFRYIMPDQVIPYLPTEEQPERDVLFRKDWQYEVLETRLLNSQPLIINSDSYFLAVQLDVPMNEENGLAYPQISARKPPSKKVKEKKKEENEDDEITTTPPASKPEIVDTIKGKKKDKKPSKKEPENDIEDVEIRKLSKIIEGVIKLKKEMTVTELNEMMEKKGYDIKDVESVLIDLYSEEKIKMDKETVSLP